jgi:hypothetical protein
VAASAQQAARIVVEVSPTVNPWNHLEVNNRAETFQFAIVTDRTGGHRPGIFEDGVDKLNLLQPEFVVSVGDLIEGYTEDEAEIQRQWEEFNGFIAKLQMPFFYVPGNHDYINPIMARIWKERYGKDYYHFVYKDVLFLCLNSEEQMLGSGRGAIGDPQYAYIEQVLKQHPEVRWTLLFMHQPLWTQEKPGRWPEVEALLANRKHTVFVGHNHRYVKYERNNGKYFILATTGGGSRLRGPRFGEFDHVVWVTMTDDGPILANLMLDGIWDENVNTEAFFTLARPLMEGKALRVEPLLLDKPVFNGGNLQLRLSNDSDVPLNAHISPQSNGSIWAATDPLSVEVPPNSVEIVSIPLKASGPVPAASLQPLALDARLVYALEGQPRLELEQSLRVMPLAPFEVPLVKKAIALDGQLGDWEGLLSYQFESPEVQGSPFAHSGKDDAHLRFGLCRDEKFLYLAAEVKDDQVEVSDKNTALNQDALVLPLDARPLRELFNSDGEGYFRQFALIAISPQESGDGEGNVYMRQLLPPGTKTWCKRTAEGYVVEVALPLSYLDAMQREPWKHFRFNPAVHDVDKAGAHDSFLFWLPDWRGEGNIAGAGLFRKGGK